MPTIENITENSASLKYNVGDKVVVLKLDFFDNWFHYKESIKEYTVKDANERFFSPFLDKLDPYCSGSNQFSICRQSDGRPLWGNERYFHKEKDAAEIKVLIEKAKQEYNDKRDAEDSKRVAQLEATIKSAKEELLKIKNGQGNFKQGFSCENRNDYLSKVMTHIEKTFPLNSEHP